MHEFDIIERYFARGHGRDDVLLGIGDDAALVRVEASRPVITAVVTLCGGNHTEFQSSGGAFAAALVRSALNRLAARGAAPAWLTLALGIPEADEAWLGEFSDRLHALVAAYGAALIGGDTVRAPLTATLVAHGVAAPAPADLGAPRIGDGIYVTGILGGALLSGPGDAGAPPPRVDAGLTAAPFAAAAGDIRESLAATLARLLDPAGLGADLEHSRLPLADAAGQPLDRALAKRFVESSPDAELCWVIGVHEEIPFNEAVATLDTPCTRIGRVGVEPGVHMDGVPL
jgi:thiamine-monophosphate kinase